MDHSFNFFIGLSYLQLNEFDKAIKYLSTSIESSRKNGDQWVNHLDLLYMGIANQELLRYEEAIKYFDWALKNYEGFSDAEYYKVISLLKTGLKRGRQKALLKNAEGAFQTGTHIQ